MNINQTIGVYNNRYWYYSDTQVSWQITRLGIISCWVDHAMVSTLLKYGHYFAKDGYWGGRQRRHSFHSLAHTAEKGDRKQSGFTSFFWQHLNMRVQSPGRQDMCLWIHPEHTHCSSTSRCQSFQKEIQNLCISWPQSENEEETVRKGKPTNVSTYIRQSILLRRVIYSFSSSHVVLQPFKLPKLWYEFAGGHAEHGTQNRGATQSCPPIHHR